MSEVILAIHVIVLLAPAAIYFVVLGLLNSQMHPLMIEGRRDGLLLFLVAIPILATLGSALIAQGLRWPAVGVTLLITAGVAWLLPRRGTSWVIYNISAGRCLRVLEKTARDVGGRLVSTSDGWRLEGPGILLRLDTLSWLRNATLTFMPGSSSAGAERERFLMHFRRRLEAEADLPSAAGAAMVMVGVALLGIPMWFAVHHAETLVEAVRDWIFA